MLNDELNFDYVIRFRGDILVTDRNGLSKRAKAWVGAKGRAKLLPDAQVTADQYPVGAVVCVQDPEMKDPQLGFVRFSLGPGPEDAIVCDVDEGLIEGQDASAHVVDIFPFLAM